ncbi:MAG: hypothetical protein ACREB3_07965, partial [Burkholderiales bacterium]
VHQAPARSLTARESRINCCCVIPAQAGIQSFQSSGHRLEFILSSSKPVLSPSKGAGVTNKSEVR